MLLRLHMCSCYVPKRYILALMAFLGFANVYALRVKLSVTIVTMTENDPCCQEWSSATQGLVLSSYFYGAIVTQVPGGILAEKFGGKWVIGVGSLVGAVVTLLTPLAAYQSLGLLLVVRIVEGFVLGVSFPAMHVMWAKWAPPLEKSKLSAISYAGPFVGTIAALAGSGFFCEYGFKSPPHDQRWPSVFYIFGCLGLIWSAAWLFIVYDSPSVHPTISSEERVHIESKIDEAAGSKKKDKKISSLWLAARFLSSPAVWAIAVSHFCSDWGFFTLLTSLPTFLSDVLGFEIRDDGLLSALPFAVMAVTVIFAGYVADFLRRREILSTTNTRKLMNSVGLLFPALFLVVTSYMSSAVLAVAFLVLAVGLSGSIYSGFFINHLDIAPRFAGVLMGITNAGGMLAGIVAPYVAGALTTANKSSPEVLKAQWRNVFFLSAELYAFGAIIFLILGTGNKQWWADGPVSTKLTKISPVQPQDSWEGETDMDPFINLEGETDRDPLVNDSML